MKVGLGGEDDNIEANKGFAYHDTKRIANLIANKLKLHRTRLFQNIKLIPERSRGIPRLFDKC